MNIRRILSLAACLGGVACLTTPVQAQQTYKIGVSAGLTGYAANVDRAWRDGLEIAIAYVNAKGGVLGRKLEMIVEDNKSEPQEAVTVYRKMISSDKVDIFISGCVSAGNFAAAPVVARAQIPMMLCSILPPQPDQVKWAYSFLAPPRFEIEVRYQYLKDRTNIRKIGILHDPTPYAIMMKDNAVKLAADFGIEVAVVEQYKQDDADFSPQISKINASGAKAIVKIGMGGSTITAARNVKQLGLDLPLLASTDDLAASKPAGETLGPQFMFAAGPPQVYDALPEGELKKEIARFLPLWQAKWGDRDPFYPGKAWDAVMVTIAAIEQAKSFEGPKVRDEIEKIVSQGTGGRYNFSPTVHQGITVNPFFIGTFVGGKVQVKQ